MRVVAHKIPGGWLIPAEGELEQLPDERITVELTLLPREKSDKEIAAEAAVERYLEKQQRELPSSLSTEDRETAYHRLGVEGVHSLEDALHRLQKA